MRDHGLRFDDRNPRQRAVGQDRRHLQADDEGSPDHGGHDLRDKSRALGSDERETSRP